ncbi:hypothetical protein [Caulobacter sp. 17J65-9]|uniref:hypothetical protein n=1 Tax=Caulobacter sp. 17J65-9 TaxID=2709382 RepID=UPI0013CD8784|nr:hypothetical protein [Caulobacter sp. 17J65-9]NEX94046.1 hypothetical protein [Caulobacter sp. 17J65-9]
MSRRLVAGLSAALALAAASSGQAQDKLSMDRVYQYKSGHAEILEPLDGKAYWSILAECSGFDSSYALYLKMYGGGDVKAAEDNGVRFLESSITRLMKDRKISFDAARAIASQRAGQARASTDKMRQSGTGPNSQWNMMRSLCGDFGDQYKRSGL